MSQHEPSTRTDWNIWASSRFASLSVLGKEHHHLSSAQGARVDTVPDTLLYLHIEPCWFYLSMFLNVVYFPSPSVPSPWFTLFSFLSNSVHRKQFSPRSPRGPCSTRSDAYFQHLPSVGVSEAWDSAEHPFLESHLLWLLVWQRCGSGKIRLDNRSNPTGLPLPTLVSLHVFAPG